jgi:hypothetical protein
MKDSIQVKFDEELKGYGISMPDIVSISAIEEWTDRFGSDLRTTSPGQKTILLIDTNQHQFESIQCLRILRDFFANISAIKSNGVKVAFVQPANFVEPQIKSDREAYFESFEEAYEWLGA